MSSLQMSACPLPSAADCPYSACYCEENVYQLCAKLQTAGPEHLDRSWVVFISNPKRSIPLWRQKAGTGPKNKVIWDYHVILLYCGDKDGSLIYDLDTRLPFPSSFKKYCKKTLRPDQELEAKFHRQFRAVPGSVFLTSLSSDRRHMRVDEKWLQQPPDWPCIQAGGEGHNLDTFIDMEAEGHGELFGLDGFINRFK
jgi:hypothetical protein